MSDLIMVLGIGSPFGDDRVGWQVIENLKQKSNICNKVHLEICNRPGANLIALMQPAQTVFLIDAVKTGAEVGTVHRWQNMEIEGLKNLSSTHDFGIAEALQLGRVLGALPANIILYGIEIDSINTEFFNDSVRLALEQVVSYIEMELSNLCL